VQQKLIVLISPSNDNYFLREGGEGHGIRCANISVVNLFFFRLFLTTDTLCHSTQNEPPAN